jgi:hypothetical protein
VGRLLRPDFIEDKEVRLGNYENIGQDATEENAGLFDGGTQPAGM